MDGGGFFAVAMVVRRSVHTIITEYKVQNCQTQLTYDGYTSDTTTPTGTSPAGGTKQAK